jgi:hypothetical protein
MAVGASNSQSEIAVTVDGGHQWKERSPPADAPKALLSGLSCPAANVCWVAGSDDVAQVIGNAADEGSSVLLGTVDDGSIWQTVRFHVPPTAPNDQGESYLAIGAVTCPSVNACMALGETAQGSPVAPIYTLR